MDTITLVTTALALAKPFIEKVAEGSASKIGEEIWDFVKKPFVQSNCNIEELSSDELQFELTEIINTDQNFKSKLEKLVNDSQSKLSVVNQYINNNKQVEKQINIGTNHGPVSM